MHRYSNVIYFFRVIKIACFEEPQPDYQRQEAYPVVEVEEVPMAMLIPILLAATSIIAAGLGSHWIVNNFVQPLLKVVF